MNVLIPGTFSILHYGHTNIYLYLQKKTYLGEMCSPCFGVTESPYDKSLDSLSERLDQFKPYDFDYVTLHGKSILEHKIQFSHSVKSFVVGIAIGHDTFKRMLDPKYYLGSVDLMKHIVEERLRNTHFFIFPRNGKLEIDSRILPRHLNYITDFEEINISSTEIKNAGPN